MSKPPRLSRNDIRAYVGAIYYTRGLSYFEQGRVLAIELVQAQAQIVRLRAQVRGTGGRIYSQSIVIRWESYGASLDGDCDCPVGYNCKHVAAACLHFRQSQSDFLSSGSGSTDVAKTWLTRVAAAGIPGEEPAEERLLYVLQPREPDVEVELRVARPLKSGGGLSKGRPLLLASVASTYSQPNYMQASDVEILRLLRGISTGSWPMVSRLTGAIGRVALDQMLTTGRCHWGRHDEGALVRGGPRVLDIAWLQQDDGAFAIALKAEPPARLLLTEPAAYVDPVRHEVGVLETHGLNTGQLRELIQAPRLARDQAEAVSRLLLREFPQLPLPTPMPVRLERIDGIEPVPCLILRGPSPRPPDGGSRQRAAEPPFGRNTGPDAIRPAAVADNHLLVLSFDYAGHPIPALPASAHSVVDTAEGMAEIQRDLAAESAAAALLAERGFRPVPSGWTRGPLLFSAAGNGLIERASLWSTLLRETVPKLELAGWRIEVEDSFRLCFEAADWDACIDQEAAGGNDWFGLRFDLEFGGRRLPLLPIVAPLLEMGIDGALPPIVSVPLPPDEAGVGTHRFVDLPSERLLPVLEILRELLGDLPRARDGTLRLSRFDAPMLDDLAARGIALRGGQGLRDLAQQLRDLDGIARVEPPAGLKIALRPYQHRGLDWLQFLRSFDLAGILADDMGLGKTVQTLAHIQAEREAGRLDRPALVVSPTSLVSNWLRESERFTPDLRVLVLHGSARHGRFAAIGAHDLVLTTYPLLPRDRERLLVERFHLLILDEAQTIKNPRAQAAQVVRRLDARHRLCLTGTPMENHLGELWALFDFLLPGFLGDRGRFTRFWRTPIEQQGDRERQQRLARRVGPFLLRRRKQDVLTELPPKTEIIRSIGLGGAQSALYEGVRLSMEKRVRDAIAAQGVSRSQITILDALLKLRQICCDPRLLDLPAARRATHSAKLELLMDLLPEQLEEGRRILLFSQFTRMLALIERELEQRAIGYAKLTGRTRKRDEVIDRFRSGEIDLFLISLKAGGLGLNLTEADTVILYDPWWNPAVEAQAADRAHRIGQDKPVFVYKLLTEQTVEERIMAMQQKKQALANGIYREGAANGGPALSSEDIDELFAPIAD